jgi:hypothetical protein
MSQDSSSRKRVADPLIRRAHPGPVLVAVPGDSPRLPAVRSTEQAWAQSPLRSLLRLPMPAFDRTLETG